MNIMRIWALGGGGGGGGGGRGKGTRGGKKIGIQYYYCIPVLNILHGVYVIACLSHFIVCTVKYYPNMIESSFFG